MKNKLSRMQKEVFKCLLKGKSNREIGKELGLSEKTIKFHLYNMFKILNVKSRTELIVKYYDGKKVLPTGVNQ